MKIKVLPYDRYYDTVPEGRFSRSEFRMAWQVNGIANTGVPCTRIDGGV